MGLFGHNLAVDSCFVLEKGGEVVKGRVLSSVFVKKPMNHQDNLVHSQGHFDSSGLI
jgi:hypothetical protein